MTEKPETRLQFFPSPRGSRFVLTEKPDRCKCLQVLPHEKHKFILSLRNFSPFKSSSSLRQKCFETCFYKADVSFPGILKAARQHQPLHHKCRSQPTFGGPSSSWFCLCIIYYNCVWIYLKNFTFKGTIIIKKCIKHYRNSFSSETPPNQLTWNRTNILIHTHTHNSM